MVFAGHVGVALIIAYLFRLNPLLAVIGGVLPDLDSILFFFGVKWTTAHRKITHSLLFLTPFVILSLFVPIAWALVAGLVTHLAMDLDHWGVPFLYPFIKREYSVMKIDHHLGNEFDSPIDAIKEFFKTRKAVIEFIILIVGVALTWDYWINLLNLFF